MSVRRYHLALALLAAASLRCGGDDSDSPEAPAKPALATLAACVEDDVQYIPFQGSAFDETGALKGELPPGHIVATTAGWAKQDPEIIKEVVARNQLVFADVFQRDGLYGAGFSISEKCGSSRTLSFWRDEAALTAFVFGEAHGEAIKIMDRTTNGWETTHWVEPTNKPSTFDDARAKLAEVRDER